MLNCKKVSYLASKKLDGKLSWGEHIGLMLHVAMCRLCRRYGSDITQLQALIQHNEQSLSSDSAMLSDQSRKRIKQVLNKALQQSTA